MSDFTNFVPKRHLISNISNSRLASVTTEDANGYEVGQFIRLIVPGDYGMVLDFVQVQVVSLTAVDEFVCDLDTSDMDPFVAPTFPPGFSPAQAVPISGVELNDITVFG